MKNKSKRYTLRIGFMREVDALSEADAIYQMGSQMTYSTGFDGARKIMIQSIRESEIPEPVNEQVIEHAEAPPIFPVFPAPSTEISSEDMPF